jgi:hypothetical protein
MAPSGERAQRIVIVSGSNLRVEGGPARPVKLMPSNYPTSGAPILRVAVVVGRATTGGPSLPCVQVSGSGGLGGDIVPVVLT